MRIDIKVVDALGIERGGPTLDAPNPISFRQKQLSQIGSILPRHPGYECSLLHEVPCSRKKAECLHAAQIGAMVEEPSIVMLQRSEEHTSELQSLMRSSYAVFCLKTKKTYKRPTYN